MADCIHHPEQPHVPGTPPRVDARPIFGWDAGANSVREESGSARLVFTMGKVVGAVVGIAAQRADVGNYTRITHAFSFVQNSAGQPRAQIMEAGVLKGQAFGYTESTAFEIWRVGSSILYIIDGVRRYVSRTPSTGTIFAACALYGSGDAVP